MATHIILVRINPEVPTRGGNNQNWLPIKPAKAATSTGIGVEQRNTTGISAPPMGITGNRPSNSARTMATSAATLPGLTSSSYASRSRQEMHYLWGHRADHNSFSSVPAVC